MEEQELAGVRELDAADEARLEREFEAEYGAGADSRRDDVVLLHTALMNERCSPELLDYEGAVVDSLRREVAERQEALLDTQRTVEAAFRARLLQMDLDRVRYALAEYLRTRLRKIQAFTLHILGDAALHGRLSAAEMRFAKRFIDLEAEHMQRSAVDRLPKVHRGLTEQTAQEDMVPRPDLDAYVFCRAERDVPDVSAGDDGQAAVLTKGDILAIRYSRISDLLRCGDVVLV